MKICLILEKFSPVVFPWLCKEDITSVGHAALVDGVEGHDGHVEEHLGGVAWTQSHGYHGADQTPHTRNFSNQVDHQMSNLETLTMKSSSNDTNSQ